MLSFTLGASSIAVFLDGVFNSIDSSHANYPLLLAELQKAPADRDLEAIRTYITIKALIEHLSIGRVTVFEDAVHFDGNPVHNYMTERMLEILAQGIDLTPWAAFMDNVMDNPAEYARAELYEWMEKADMPLTPDGCFLAFKKVRRDYTDCHTGRFDNSPGNVLEMDRDACNPNRHQTCSTGFHFCSIGYIGHFGGERVVVVKINPRDVTSIPSDYNFTKGRCCRYEVVGELDGQSAAYHNCWRKGVVDLENPAEFPDGILKSIVLPDPVANAPVSADSDPAEYDDTYGHDLEFSAEETCALVENEMTDAGSFTVPLTREVIQAAIDEAGANWTAGEPVEIPSAGIALGFDWENVAPRQPSTNPVTLAVALGASDESPIFTTSDGREFSAEVIKAALEDASIRGAARNLGIQDSTLRGWKKKLGL